MNLYNSVAINQPDLADKVLEIGEKALKLSETRPHVYFEMGQAAFTKKEFDRGLEYFRKAIALNPEPRETQLNYLLATIFGRKESLTVEQMKFMKDKYGGFSENDYRNIARGYASVGNDRKVIETFREATKTFPTSDFYAQLAGAYGKICDIPNARAAANEAARLNPDLSSAVVQFLQQTEQTCQ